MDNLIEYNIDLADKNWFKTGGKAKFYAAPLNVSEFIYAIEYALDNNLEIFVLGQGANVLISDEGFQGLVIAPKFSNISIVDKKDINNNILVKADSGVIFQDLIDWTLDHNIIGLQEFSGIPGTVGGSVFINIHYFNFLLSDFVEFATIYDTHLREIINVDKYWFNFNYNYSKLLDSRYYLIDATFKLKFADDLETFYHKGRKFEIIRHRKSRYPYNNTCGSFFRNFYDHEVSIESNGKKMVYVAYYLDKLGIKGTLSYGDAIVSYQHANMIVNKGNAKSLDIINLAIKMQELVFEKFNIVPQPECRLVGFSKYPLKI
jgi:UDP-N-acetylmuramate dehydrogenase